MKWDEEKPNPVRAFHQPAVDESLADSRERPGGESGPEEVGMREMGYAMVYLIVEYLKGLEGRRVYGPLSPAGMDDMFDEDLPEEGTPFLDLVQDCRTRVFPNTMAIGSRRYFGMMNPAPLPMAVFSEALCSAMNQNVASWRHAPSGTAIEKRVIRWLCDMFGLPEGSFGTMTDGGSLANITGLKLAINRVLGRDLSQVDNLDGPGSEIARLTFYVSGQAHYSFDKAVDLLGLGRGQLRKIPFDDIFRIDLEALEEQIRTFDLYARRAFFSNQEQRRTGGLLLLGGAVVCFIALKFSNLWKPKLPVVEKKEKE